MKLFVINEEIVKNIRNTLQSYIDYKDEDGICSCKEKNILHDFDTGITLLKELKKIITQLESCNYECEGGKLEGNKAWIALKEMVE